MSARSVWSGMRPSLYPSVRAISAPFRRPATCTLIPSAPARMAFCTARFMARRKLTRCTSWCAIESATSCASTSGRLTSSTLIATSAPPERRPSSSRSLSTSAPPLPITTPGRAVCTVTITLPGLRSMLISLSEACPRRWFRYLRILASSTRSAGKFRSAYQRLRQGATMPRRKPRGCVFCPIGLLLAVDDDGELRGPLDDRRGPPHGPGREALHAGTLVGVGLLHHQLVDVDERPGRVGGLGGVGHGRAEGLLDGGGRTLLRELEDRVRLVHPAAADQVQDQAYLAGAHADALGECACFHVFSPGLARLRALVDELAAVPLEGARRGELAELVAHHLLGEVHGDELVAVVHRQRVADELGGDGGAARPGLGHALLAPLVHRPDLLLEALLYEGPLLQASGHSFLDRT